MRCWDSVVADEMKCACERMLGVFEMGVTAWAE